MKFKIDSGASVTGIPVSLNKELGIELSDSKVMLRGARNQPLRTRGYAQTTLNHREASIKERDVGPVRMDQGIPKTISGPTLYGK